MNFVDPSGTSAEAKAFDGEYDLDDDLFNGSGTGFGGGKGYYSGSKSPKNVDIENGAYVQYDNNGNIYSYTVFENGNQIFRIDIQGRPHNGWLPHIHVYSYNDNGLRNGKATYNILGNRID